CKDPFSLIRTINELTNGKLKEEALAHKARIKESRGDATPGVMKFCEWLKNGFENIHKLDYDVLVKLEECWWKVNAHEKPHSLDGKITARDRLQTPKLKRIMTLILILTVSLVGIMDQTTPDLAQKKSTKLVKYRSSGILLIMEYLVKISKKARILELKQRHLKITVLTSNTPYPSRKIRRICACTSLKTTKEQDPIRRLRKKYRLSLKNDMPPRDK
ncbi:hypothetical protein Tco_1207103, partial [Tanacetum coccineum]